MAKNLLTFDDLNAFIVNLDDSFRVASKNTAKDNQLHTLGVLAKLSEETGELAEAILAFYGEQRASKGKRPHVRHEIALEIADVYIVTALLARHFDIDITSALSEKMAQIRQRHLKGDI